MGTVITEAVGGLQRAKLPAAWPLEPLRGSCSQR
jgi:hypothetical protein